MSPLLRRNKRSRDDAITFEVASFEYLRTGEAEVLLRLEGVWLAGREQGVPGIELWLERGLERVVLDPLPDPSNFPVAASPAGVAWRAAFPASLAAAGHSSARYVLALGDGITFDLPAPVDRDAPSEPEPQPEPAPKAKRVSAPGALAALPEAERIKAIIAESIQRFAVLEERIENERVARVEAEERLAAALESQPGALPGAAPDGLDEARAEVEKLHSLVQVANAARKEVETRIAARDAELTAARAETENLAARVREAEARVAAVEARAMGTGDLAEDRANVENDLREAVRAAEEAAQEAAITLEDAVGERARVESRVSQLEADAAEARQLASAEAMAREELQRELESGGASVDEVLKRELEQARETAVRERGQRASFEQELKRRDNELRNAIAELEGEAQSLRAELAQRDQLVADLQGRAEEAHARILSAEKAASEARVARSNIERDLRELSESGDDAETVLARHKAELADLRQELENALAQEERAQRRIADLERAEREAGDGSQVQQVMGEVDRLRASLGHVTERFERESARRRELEEELQSRVVAEERLRAMLQAKVPAAGAGDAPNDGAELDVPAPDVSGGVATSRGDFLERLAAAKQRAAAVDR